MPNSIFTIILLGISILFFYQSNFLFAVALLVWGIYRISYSDLQRLHNQIGEFATPVKTKKETNVYIELRLLIEKILKSSSVDELYKKLKENKIIEKEKDLWVSDLLNNYKKTNVFGEGLEIIEFNVKDNQIWKNGKINFDDAIYHDIFIPYKYINGKERESVPFLTPSIEVGLLIRVFIVNGFLKLQVGEFNKKYSPKVMKEGALSVYQNYDTISTFPLIYFSYVHNLPEKYLNLCCEDTEGRRTRFNKDEKTKSDSFSDWRELNKEIQNYNFICNYANEYIENNKANKKWEKIVKDFGEKKEKLLIQDGFKDELAEYANDVFNRWETKNKISYYNDYIRVFIIDNSEAIENQKRYLYVDYYEQMP